MSVWLTSCVGPCAIIATVILAGVVFVALLALYRWMSR